MQVNMSVTDFFINQKMNIMKYNLRTAEGHSVCICDVDVKIMELV